MAEYTAFVEAGNALVELLRDELTPEPIGDRELIALCSPHESENNQLTVYLYQTEEDTQGVPTGYYQASRDIQRISPSRYILRFMITAHSKAPVQMRQADQYRLIGAVIQVLKDHPLLDQKYLTGSLAQDGPAISLQLEKTPMDMLLKIWNNTSSTYKLSVVAALGNVEIDSRRTRKVSRVRDITIGLEEKPRGGEQ